jgi:hypothetical protein
MNFSIPIQSLTPTQFKDLTKLLIGYGYAPCSPILSGYRYLDVRTWNKTVGLSQVSYNTQVNYDDIVVVMNLLKEDSEVDLELFGLATSRELL